MKSAALRVMLAACGAVLCVVLVGSRWREGEGAHARTLSIILELGATDARLDEDVMKAQAGLLTHFDGLVAALRQMHTLLGRLRDGLKAPGFNPEARAQLTERLDALDALLTTKETAVEQFKSQTAVLRNSLAYFPPASHALVDKLLAANNDVTARLVERLTLQVSLHVVAPSPENAASIEAAAAALEQAPLLTPDRQEETTWLIRHARAIKERKARVEELVTRVVALPARDRVDALWRNHRELEAVAAAQLQRREAWLIGGLLACCVLWSLSLWLSWRARTLEAANNASLQDRLWQGALPASLVAEVARRQQPVFREATEVSVLSVSLVPPPGGLEGISAAQGTQVMSAWGARARTVASEMGVEGLTLQGNQLLWAAGLFAPMVHHAEQVARLSLRLLDEAAQMRWPGGEPVQVRLGIHCGPVKTGVELTPHVRFFAFGEGVDGAAAAMMAAVPGQVLLTNHARSRLVHLFGLKENGVVTVAGVGAVPCFSLFTPGGAQPASLQPAHG